MDLLVKLVAPSGKRDFVAKLALLVLISGVLIHLRDVLSGYDDTRGFIRNVVSAAWIAVPLGGLGLGLIGYLSKLQHTLRAQALQDSLTGLANRRAFVASCPAIWDRERVLLMIDLDLFKQVNDVYGHQTGDTALRHFARFMKSVVPANAIIGRLGGEEFGIILKGDDTANARTMALNISAGTKLLLGSGQVIGLTASVGMTHPDVAMTFQETFALADRALYCAKSRGRAQVCALPDYEVSGGGYLSKPIFTKQPIQDDGRILRYSGAEGALDPRPHVN